MSYHRGLLFWGLALITGGAVALAAQQGYLNRDLLAGAWRLWPLILVAIGLSIMLSRTRAAIVGTIVAALIVGTAGGALIAVGPGSFACGGADPTNLVTRHGNFGGDASVKLDFNCGTLKVGMADGNQWTLAGGQTGGAAAQVTADAGRLEVRSRQPDSWFNEGRQRWNVTLPRTPAYKLEISPNAADASVDLGGGTFTSVSIHPNAGSISVDLSGAQVDNLDLSLNAGSASILIGSGTELTGSLSVNAGSIELCTAGDVALRITSDPNLTFSTNLDKSGLAKSSFMNAWSTAGYSAAPKKVEIKLSGNAGSFTLNPEGGCK